MNEQGEGEKHFGGELRNYLPQGLMTEKFFEENPSVRSHFEHVGCRIEGHEIGSFPRLVLVYPGLHHSKADQKKSIREFWDIWADLPIQASKAQVTYPNHTFVPGLMYSQIEDLIIASGAKEVDLVSFSFGGPFAIQQITDLRRKNLDVKVRSLGLIITGLEGDHLNPLMKVAGKVLDKFTKVPGWFKIPSGVHSFSRGLGGRLGNISDQTLDPTLLPKDLKVLLMLAKKDLLFNSPKVATKVGELYPEAKVVWLPGGHGWDEQKTREAGRLIQDFLTDDQGEV